MLPLGRAEADGAALGAELLTAAPPPESRDSVQLVAANGSVNASAQAGTPTAHRLARSFRIGRR